MALVGKKFPNFEVDAMNEMGDTFKINVYEQAVNHGKKVLLFFWKPYIRSKTEKTIEALNSLFTILDYREL